jgi:hypothetical protein
MKPKVDIKTREDIYQTFRGYQPRQSWVQSHRSYDPLSLHHQNRHGEKPPLVGNVVDPGYNDIGLYVT